MTSSQTSSRLRLASRLLVLSCVGAVLGGCGGGPQCVADTHCKIDQRCVEQRCVPLHPDAGPGDGGLDAALDGSPDSGRRDSGVRDSGPADSGPPPTGQILAFSDQVDFGVGPAARTVVTAAFQAAPAGGCTTREVGGCTVTQCPDTSPPIVDAGAGDAGVADSGPADSGPADSGAEDSGAPEAAPNAGVIVVRADGPTATLPPAPDGSYAPFTAASLLWADGSATVNFNAFGATPGVPAFTQEVPAPTSVILTAPDLSTGTATLTRLSGVELAWTGSTAGVIRVSLTQAEPAPSTASVSVRCDLDPTSGTGNVSPIALTSFGPGDASLSVASVSTGNPSGTEPWVVEVAAAAMSSLPSGRVASVTVTLD